MKKVFDHPKYPQLSNRYEVDSETGEITNLIKNEIVKVHDSYHSRKKFVRLSGEGDTISLTVAKVILLTFKPKPYTKDQSLVAVVKDDDNINLNTIFWGTREDQAQLHISKTVNFKRVQKMGRKHGPINFKNHLLPWMRANLNMKGATI